MGSNRVTVGTALPAGNNNIGDVDVASLPALPAGANAIGSVTANAGTNLNTSALALETTQTAGNVLSGAVTETAPATDIAASGLNGRLQRIAQNITTLIAKFTVGAGTEAAALRVTLPTDGTGKVNAAQSGTWTVQPGNAANTTAWKVDGSAVTQPVSGTVKVSFPATATAITCTLSSLASSGTVGRASTAVDNSTNLDDDALVMVSIAYPNSVPANDKAIYVYAYGSYDGTTYPEAVSGTDAAYTFQGAAGALLTAHRLIGVIPGIQNVTAVYGPFSVAAAFGGILPPKWGLIFLNFSGQTLGTTSVAFTRVQFKVV